MTKRKKVAAGNHHVPDSLLVGQAGLGKGVLLPHLTEPVMDSTAQIYPAMIIDPRNDMLLQS